MFWFIIKVVINMIREINEMKDRKWLTFKSFLVALSLAFAFTWFPQIIGAFIYFSGKTDETIAVIIGNIVTAIIIFAIFFPMLYNNFKDYVSNIKTNYKISVKFWLKGFLIMYVANFILAYFVFPGQIAENEELNRAFMNSYPVLAFFEVCIIAPFMEEMVFRYGLRKAWGKNKAFPLVSGLVFGLLHALTGISSLAPSELLELLYIIPYGALGYAFGYLYNKTDNIFFSMSVHMTHNFLSYLLIMLLA